MATTQWVGMWLFIAAVVALVFVTISDYKAKRRSRRAIRRIRWYTSD